MDERASRPAARPAPPAAAAPAVGALAPVAVPEPSPPADPPLPASGRPRPLAPREKAPGAGQPPLAAAPREDLPAPGQPAPATGAGKWQPGLFWYWLCVLMLIAGIAWPLVGMRVTDARIATFQRVPLPAGGQVRLPHTGTYVISYEAAGASERDIPSFRITARPVSPKLRVTLLPDASGTVYAASRRQGVVVLDLKVSRPGAIFLGARGAPAIPGGSALAVGSRLPGFVPAVVPGIGLMLGGIVGIVMVATLRSRGALMRIRYPSLAP